MGKSIEALTHAFSVAFVPVARTPRCCEGIRCRTTASIRRLHQVASINVEDARTLAISPWEKKLMSEIEKAILKSDLGITPASNADVDPHSDAAAVGGERGAT